MNNYDLALNHGYGVPIDQNEATLYFKMAAEKGHPDGMNNYAHSLSNGIGIPVDENKAYYYFKLSAEKGSIQGMNSYAKILREDIDFLINTEEANHKIVEDKRNEKEEKIYKDNIPI